MYKVSHSRKKLYKILYDYVQCLDGISNEFIDCMKYDYVFNNQHEDIPDYLIRESEDKYRLIKRYLANDADFRKTYFAHAKKEEKIVNDFRIVEIGKNATLFIYYDKDNIFNRCLTHVINHAIEEIDYEQKR